VPVPEPINELWNEVITFFNPWPPDDEDAAEQLGQAWLDSANAMAETQGIAGGGLAILATAWPDPAGRKFFDDVLAYLKTRAQVETDMRRLAKYAFDYALEIYETKISIIAEIALNLPQFLRLGNPLVGGLVAWVTKKVFAKMVADMLKEMVAKRAAKFAARMAIEAGQEAATDIIAQLEAKRAGFREEYDLQQTAESGGAGVVNAFVAPLAHRPAGRLARIPGDALRQRGAERTAQIVESTVQSGATNAATSPFAGTVSHNVISGTPEQLLSAGEWVDSYRSAGQAATTGGLNGGLEGTSRVIGEDTSWGHKQSEWVERGLGGAPPPPPPPNGNAAPPADSPGEPAARAPSPAGADPVGGHPPGASTGPASPQPGSPGTDSAGTGAAAGNPPAASGPEHTNGTSADSAASRGPVREAGQAAATTPPAQSGGSPATGGGPPPADVGGDVSGTSGNGEPASSPPADAPGGPSATSGAPSGTPPSGVPTDGAGAARPEHVDTSEHGEPGASPSESDMDRSAGAADVAGSGDRTETTADAQAEADGVRQGGQEHDPASTTSAEPGTATEAGTGQNAAGRPDTSDRNAVVPPMATGAAAPPAHITSAAPATPAAATPGTATPPTAAAPASGSGVAQPGTLAGVSQNGQSQNPTDGRTVPKQPPPTGRTSDPQDDRHDRGREPEDAAANTAPSIAAVLSGEADASPPSGSGAATTHSQTASQSGATGAAAAAPAAARSAAAPPRRTPPSPSRPAPRHTSAGTSHAAKPPAPRDPGVAEVRVDLTASDPDFELKAAQAFVDALNATDADGHPTPQAQALYARHYKVLHQRQGRWRVDRLAGVSAFTVVDGNGDATEVGLPMLDHHGNRLRLRDSAPVPGKVRGRMVVPLGDLPVGERMRAYAKRAIRSWRQHDPDYKGEHVGEDFAELIPYWLQQKYPGEQLFRLVDLPRNNRSFDMVFVRRANGRDAGWVIVEAKSPYSRPGHRIVDGRAYQQGHPGNVRGVAEDMARCGGVGALREFTGDPDGTTVWPADTVGGASETVAGVSILRSLTAGKVDFWLVRPALDGNQEAVGLDIEQYDMTLGSGQGWQDDGSSPDDPVSPDADRAPPAADRGNAAEIWGSDFHGRGREFLDPAAVLHTAAKALPEVAADAGVRKIVRVGPDRYLVIGNDRSSFHVDLRVGPLKGHAVAEYEARMDSRTARITVSDTARNNVIERGLAHEIAELAQLFAGNDRTEDVLTEDSDARVDPDLSRHDHGRVGELRNVERNLDQTSRMRVLRRRYLRGEMTKLVEHLGLGATQEGAVYRRAALPEDVAEMVRRRAGEIQDLADRHPKQPGTTASVAHRLGMAAPALGAAGVFYASGNGALGVTTAAVAVTVAVATGVTDRRMAINEDRRNTTETDEVSDERRAELADKRREHFRQLARQWAQLGVRHGDPGPSRAARADESRWEGLGRRLAASWRITYVHHGLPLVIVTGVVAATFPLGLPVVSAIGLLGSYTLRVAAMPLIERWFNSGRLAYEFKLKVDLGRPVVEEASRLEDAFAWELSERFRRLAELDPGLLNQKFQQVQRDLTRHLDMRLPELKAKPPRRIVFGAKGFGTGAQHGATQGARPAVSHTEGHGWDLAHNSVFMIYGVLRWALSTAAELLPGFRFQREELANLEASRAYDANADLVAELEHRAQRAREVLRHIDDRIDAIGRQLAEEGARDAANRARLERFRSRLPEIDRAADPFPVAALSGEARTLPMASLRAHLVKGASIGGGLVLLVSGAVSLLGLPDLYLYTTMAAAGGELLSATAQWLYKKHKVRTGDLNAMAESIGKMDGKFAEIDAEHRALLAQADQAFDELTLQILYESRALRPRLPEGASELLSHVAMRPGDRPVEPGAVPRPHDDLRLRAHRLYTVLLGNVHDPEYGAKLLALEQVVTKADLLQRLIEFGQRTGNTRPAEVVRQEFDDAIAAVRKLFGDWA
jgi:hypothetical protein